MKTTISMLAAVSTVAWVMCLAGSAMADDSVGACVDLLVVSQVTGADTDDYAGFDLTDIFGGTPVPVGTLGEHFVIVDADGPLDGEDAVSVYGSSADGEAACCEESGLPADCFAPIQ